MPRRLTSPPFENLEGDEYVGFDIELARAIAAELGVECEFTTVQFDGIVPLSRPAARSTWASPASPSIRSAPSRLTSPDPYYIADQGVAVMKGGAITADNVDTALNAEGMIVAVQSGSTGETFAQENYPNAKVQPYGNATDAFAAMQAGQANAVHGPGGCRADALLRLHRRRDGEEGRYRRGYAVAVPKDNPELLKAINAAIKTLQENGTIDDLTARFLG